MKIPQCAAQKDARADPRLDGARFTDRHGGCVYMYRPIARDRNREATVNVPREIRERVDDDKPRPASAMTTRKESPRMPQTESGLISVRAIRRALPAR